MRKTAIGLLVPLLVALALCFGLVGCGGSAATTDAAEGFAGTWEISGMTSGSEQTTADELELLKSLGASVYLTLSGVISMAGGFVFGMLRNTPSKARLLIVTAVLVGVAYACMVFVDSMLTMFVFGLIASVFYAPFLISENAAVESAVPPTHLTEALTWITIGANCGLAFGPTLAGLLLDEFGVTIAFSCGALFAIFIPIIALAFKRLIYRDVN
jgi:MFS family permease